ncbi:MAG: hypothetical protein IPO91_04625 [Chloroflexi bacterium]|nr:hypothetical protein [Chloroflexota bacterium]
MQRLGDSPQHNGKFGRCAWTGLVLVCLLLTSAFVIPISAQDTPPDVPPQVGSRPDAPTYALHGPYWVGTQTFVGEDVDGPLDMRVWYPALNSSGVDGSISYTMHWKSEALGFTRDQLLVLIAGHALADAEVDLSAAPYPLVIFSHGHTSESPLYAWLVEQIASYGFVVVAPDHKEQNFPDAADYPRTTLARPVTVARSIDYAEMLTAPTGALAGMIDMEHVAMVGHSGGGETTLSVGGGRFDLAGYKALCAPITADSPWGYQNQCTPMPTETEAEMVNILGLATTPEGLWEPLSDSRIDALVPISAPGVLFNDQGLSGITLPTLVMSGTLDGTVPFDWGSRMIYDHITSNQKILVAFELGDHQMFTSTYEDAPTTVELLGNDFYSLYSDPVWDMDRVHDLANHFITAFLLDQLKGDADAHAALATEAVSFPGITYEAQGF